MGETSCWSRGRKPLAEEEAAAETAHEELTTAPVPCLLVLLGEKR